MNFGVVRLGFYLRQDVSENSVNTLKTDQKPLAVPSIILLYLFLLDGWFRGASVFSLPGKKTFIHYIRGFMLTVELG